MIVVLCSAVPCGVVVVGDRNLLSEVSKSPGPQCAAPKRCGPQNVLPPSVWPHVQTLVQPPIAGPSCGPPAVMNQKPDGRFLLAELG
jgi:hypothetical protein